ncbi:hypothetical protein BDY21DRAFT_53726 [Lineolata rhizophorae]|uniref:Uncharacterized protein n=1 Tax=Lineolata rhizophorae TaxID=578093 RepID=A0A6A6NXU6_9PEZI|nr:hypothetical protein BDY21DRAFT_53726 [Lineolata rhizophorae]
MSRSVGLMRTMEHMCQLGTSIISNVANDNTYEIPSQEEINRQLSLPVLNRPNVDHPFRSPNHPGDQGEVRSPNTGSFPSRALSLARDSIVPRSAPLPREPMSSTGATLSRQPMSPRVASHRDTPNFPGNRVASRLNPSAVAGPSSRGGAPLIERRASARPIGGGGVSHLSAANSVPIGPVPRRSMPDMSRGRLIDSYRPNYGSLRPSGGDSSRYVPSIEETLSAAANNDDSGFRAQDTPRASSTSRRVDFALPVVRDGMVLTAGRDLETGGVYLREDHNRDDAVMSPLPQRTSGQAGHLDRRVASLHPATASAGRSDDNGPPTPALGRRLATNPFVERRGF